MPDEKLRAGFAADYAALLRDSLDFIFSALRRSWAIVLLIIAGGAAAGTAYWYSQPAFYESEIVCQYVNQPFGKKVFGEMAEKLDQLARTRSAAELARQLGISPAQAGGILCIEARNRSGSPLFEDITEEYQPLYFRVRALDRSVFAALESTLPRYLGTTPYQQRMSFAQERRISGQIGQLQLDLSRIDSLLAAYTDALRDGRLPKDSLLAAQAFGARAMLEYRSGLEERLVNLERQRRLDSGDVIKIMHRFAPADRPGRGSRKSIAAFMIGAAVLALIVAITRRSSASTHA